MNQPSFNSLIDFIGEFFSDIPPRALAIIISIITLALYVLGGIVIASIVGFLALGITHSGPVVFGICMLLVGAASALGLFKAIKNYRSIMLSYDKSKV